MAIATALRQLLLADTDVSEAVGVKIHPVVIPQNTSFPAIAIELVSTEGMLTKDFVNLADTQTVSLKVASHNYDEAVSIAQKVRAVLDDLHGIQQSGVRICDTFFRNEMDGVYDNDSNLFHRIITYEISIHKDYDLQST